MAANVVELIEALENHIERKNAQLEALRAENSALKQQLSSLQRAQNAHETDQLSAQATSLVQADALEDAQGPLSATPDKADIALADAAGMQGAIPAGADASASYQTSHAESGTIDAIEREVVDQPAESSGASHAESGTPPSPSALLKQWYARYPQAFFKGHTKPLKVGIHQDLAEREPWSGKLIRRALANYVNLPRYVKSMREGVERVDLDGQPAGKVDKQAAQHAQQRRKDDGAPPEAGRSSNHAGQEQEAVRRSAEPGKPRHEAAKDTRRRRGQKNTQGVSTEPPELLSLEDKLRGLQQKFKQK